ncbi:hypothetical protein BCT04_16135 [Vibrio breoganii]|uniref:glycosyltransferase family 2 protein n=1 Tax=Vibrio breoganii TaxID=553239 RepID=UPI000CB1E57B|nr:glycosyltransferase [Vibrio breoganii]PMO63057.1 hypothetical protein BCT04_16135 [Vibrio breoganii]
MKLSKKVSVILPVYNAENYIEESVDSILKQTYSNIELIIIDDGSTDRSLELINTFATSDPRVIIISRANKGLVYSLNEAINKCKGDYIARMDADDISHPTRIEEQVKYLEQNYDVSVVGCWARVFGDSGTIGYIRHENNHEKLLNKLVFSVCFCHPTVMFRKEVFRSRTEFYNPDKLACEDYDLWVYLSRHFRFGNIEKVLLEYRYNESGITRNADNDRKYESRKMSLTEISQNFMNGIELTNNERDLHFILSSNERIDAYQPNILESSKYLLKLFFVNKQNTQINQHYLMRFLLKKVLIVLYFKTKNSFRK